MHRTMHPYQLRQGGRRLLPRSYIQVLEHSVSGNNQHWMPTLRCHVCVSLVVPLSRVRRACPHELITACNAFDSTTVPLARCPSACLLSAFIGNTKAKNPTSATQAWGEPLLLCGLSTHMHVA